MSAQGPSATLPEGTWYKPVKRFTFNGETWTTNGYIAIVGEAEAAEKDHSKTVAAMLAGCTEETELDREAWVTTRNGAVFAPYLIDFTEQVHGAELRWMIESTGDIGPMAAYVGDRPVALMMSRRGISGECPCPWCNGKGFAEECGECEGDGSVRHECTCGNMHEHDCDDCGGAGGVGTCRECDGSKVYRGAGGKLAVALDALRARAS